MSVHCTIKVLGTTWFHRQSSKTSVEKKRFKKDLRLQWLLWSVTDDSIVCCDLVTYIRLVCNLHPCMYFHCRIYLFHTCMCCTDLGAVNLD